MKVSNGILHNYLKLSMISLILATVSNYASAKEYISQSKATEVIELFTSEGCSSCPPAERWLNSLKTNPELFKSLIPMAFHVDYWDYIGWKDRFAKPAYSLRQRQYINEGSVSQAYTPQLVANSNEWRGFISGQRQWVRNDENVGVLKATIDDNAKSIFVNFSSDQANTKAAKLKKASYYRINVAILGMDLSSEVTGGENHGIRLHHDFVVLNQKQQKVSATTASWQIPMPIIPDVGQKQSAIVIWLSAPDSQRIIQAAGGYL